MVDGKKAPKGHDMEAKGNALEIDTIEQSLAPKGAT